tara:strand:- start:266 stop:553 length:288 start_codon:yes stop_codon:yes gene_type:complete
MIFAMMGQSDNSWFGENSLFGKFKGLFAVIIVAVFLLMIDAGSPKGIPIVRQLNELLLGESTFAVGSEALGTLIGVSMVLLFPVIIIMFLNRKDS